MDSPQVFANSILSTKKNDFVLNEERVLDYWNKEKVFEQQLEITKDCPQFSFYDGPPFATGTPHYGHICAGTIKDVITRYASMKGHFVERRFGWDCHGLPIENLIDKKLNITNRKEVIEMGIDKYNQECRKIVMGYASDWRHITNRLGRWIDFDNDYKTMDFSFMESVWWVFSQLFKKGLVYKSCRVMPYSNACNTVLSNFEANQNYQMVSDPSVVVSFPLRNDPETSLLAWTTTPWTLPTNLALSVNPDFEYVKILDTKLQRKFIIAKCRLSQLYKSAKEVAQPDKKAKQEKKGQKGKKGKKNEPCKPDDSQTKPKNEESEEIKEKEFEILETFTGKQLENLKYEPLFNYYFDKMDPKGCFKVLCSYHVTSEAGTGVVHTSPAYGDEDYKVCAKAGIIELSDPCISIDANGFFLPVVSDFSGQYIKDCDRKIIQKLKEQKKVIQNADMVHSYPMCWRSNTPLIYKAIECWFINVKSVREQLLINNKKSTWVPSWAQENRFNNWLEGAEDWCFSRDRFWGNPIPLWVSEDGEEIVCPENVKELKKLAGLPDDYELIDLHKEFVDQITIPSSKGKGVLKRIPEVFDCWFESGSMPYASIGYPFNISEEKFNQRFPADFIGEGLDQTRGWFYTLNVLGTILFDACPYKNLIVNGIVSDEHGQKLSKSKQNFPDPMNIINSIGSDPLRLYLMNSPLVRGEGLNFNEKLLRGLVKDFFNPWYNLVRLLLQEIKRYENTNGEVFVYDESLFSKDNIDSFKSVLDKWILAKTHSLLSVIHREFQAYRLYTVLDEKLRFLDHLSHWYTNLNKLRFKGDAGAEEAKLSLNVLFHCMLNSIIVMAPFVPFGTEYFYLNLRSSISESSSLRQNSVHLLRMPEPVSHFYDEKLVQTVSLFQSVITSVRSIREKRGINMKQPVTSLKLIPRDKSYIERFPILEDFFKEEANVISFSLHSNYDDMVEFDIKPRHDFLGQVYKTKYGALRPSLMKLSMEQKKEYLQTKKLKLEVLIENVPEVFELDENAFILTPTLRAKPENESIEIIANENFAFELNLLVTEDLKMRGLAREMTNRIQRFRKLSKLNLEDRICIVLEFPDSSLRLKAAFESQKDSIENTLKKPLFGRKDLPFCNILFSEEFEIEQEKVQVIIAGAAFVFNWEKVRELVADENKMPDVTAILKGMNPLAYHENDCIKFDIDGKVFKLEPKVHFRVV